MKQTRLIEFALFWGISDRSQYSIFGEVRPLLPGTADRPLHVLLEVPVVAPPLLVCPRPRAASFFCSAYSRASIYFGILMAATARAASFFCSAYSRASLYFGILMSATARPHAPFFVRSVSPECHSVASKKAMTQQSAMAAQVTVTT